MTLNPHRGYSSGPEHGFVPKGHQHLRLQLADFVQALLLNVTAAGVPLPALLQLTCVVSPDAAIRCRKRKVTATAAESTQQPIQGPAGQRHERELVTAAKQ